MKLSDKSQRGEDVILSSRNKLAHNPS